VRARGRRVRWGAAYERAFQETRRRQRQRQPLLEAFDCFEVTRLI
jgi:hypothetical protein